MTEREYIVQRPKPGPDWDEQTCRNLAAAILQGAIEDLCDPFQREQAAAWMASDNPDGFIWWCEVLGIDPEVVRRGARQVQVG